LKRRRREKKKPEQCAEQRSQPQQY
jgi:hypothetical protein